ncbi:MAG: UDP-N-acetylglucosamine--N-acetylmuramyl-(pentapeptide) pyrophosphoryl-undecaprenol N-acetylglucosamine transferase [Candidatus Saccharimonadales bacterium]
MADIVVLTGGGSGGHITPLLAVAAELKQQKPDTKVIYIGHTGDKLADIPKKDTNIDEVYSVRAGKLRRYHGEGWKQILDVPTMLLNIRDVFYLAVGMLQSRKLLKKLQPSVIFIKGGFVGVPVGLAAGRLGIPYVTHDSDAIPGLANRIIAKKAALHAVALPVDVYDYPVEKTVSTGIPLRADFVPVTEKLQQEYREQLGIPATAKLLFVIGGGLGSQRINAAVADAVPHLLGEFQELHVIHAVGRANEEDMSARYKSLSTSEQGRVHTKSYIDDVFRYSGAADIVITRAGATNLAEFALQGKACIVVPSPFLAGGHQLKNADYLEEQGAAVVIDETELAADPNRLANQVSELLSDRVRREQLGNKFATFAKPHAAAELAQLLFDQAKRAQK